MDLETGYFRCPNGHWCDFKPYGASCPRCHKDWDIKESERDVCLSIGFFKPHAPISDCDCSACKRHGTGKYSGKKN